MDCVVVKLESLGGMWRRSLTSSHTHIGKEGNLFVFFCGGGRRWDVVAIDFVVCRFDCVCALSYETHYGAS
jgi:hypothetical protein